MCLQPRYLRSVHLCLRIFFFNVNLQPYKNIRIIFLTKWKICWSRYTHTHTHTHIYIYIYIYIYYHPQIDCFGVSQPITMARLVICFKLGSKPGWLYACYISYRRFIDNLSISDEILCTYISFCLHIRLTATGVLNLYINIYKHIRFGLMITGEKLVVIRRRWFCVYVIIYMYR